MNDRSTIDERLAGWLEDGPTDAPGGILETVVATLPSIRQRRSGWRTGSWRASLMTGPVRALAAIAVVVALGLAALLVIRPTGNLGGVGGPGPSSSSIASSSAAVSPSASTTAPPSSTPTTAPTPGSSPTASLATGSCDPARLSVRIMDWQGAAGHRIADLVLTNDSAVTCSVPSLARPQLVDGAGTVLIDGTAPATTNALTVHPGGVLTTLVQDGNYCGPTPVAPVTVVFVLNGGGRLVATPASPTDATVPPCNGPAGSVGSIEMHAWAP